MDPASMTLQPLHGIQSPIQLCHHEKHEKGQVPWKTHLAISLLPLHLHINFSKKGDQKDKFDALKQAHIFGVTWAA